MTTYPVVGTVNTHKALCEIEADVHAYYDQLQDAELTALTIAVRALTVARQYVEPVNVQPLEAARETACQLVFNRLRELARAEEGGC